jgi:GH35 family endo-1,4-beta-xylanase
MTNKNSFIRSGEFLSAACFASALLSCGGNSNPNSPEETGAKLPPFFIGNHARTNFIRDDFALYWNQLTPETEGFWGSVENIRSQYNWHNLDTLYSFANQYSLTIKAHTLISSDMAPPWLGNLSPSLLAEEVESWIHDYCARYPNTPLINVVYNAMPGHYSTGVFAKGLGPDWVVQSFKWAREYCPNSVLILEDYSLLTTDTDQFIEWATPIITSGFVDAIGAQAHQLEEVSTQTIAANLDKLASLGLPIYISEWDISEEDDARQLAIMQQQLPLFYHHPAVAGITYWGYIAKHQFTANVNLLHEDNSPRPAMIWLQNYVEENPRN